MNCGFIFIIIAALIWSFDGVLRISLYSLPPSVIVFYEHLLGAFVLLFFLSKCIPDLKKITKKNSYLGGVALIATYFVTFKDITINLSSQGIL